ncbi:hypothetical protein AB0I16_26010 [Streptomyces sp. NPDC050703]|uniref:hypothetical protein n=1 Tax=Streptomyces sp. NPDC050703 TaxID=3157218 RepID=UPI0034134502
MASQTRAGTDARQPEYVTYAPKGYCCPECKQPIKSLERAIRGTAPMPAGAPAVTYRHAECPKVQS